MKLVKFVLSGALLAKVVQCSAANLLNQDRHGAAEMVIASRTVVDAMYDDILNSNSGPDIKKYFNELGEEAVKIHAPSILLNAISKGNKTAVDTLIELGADPFKAHKVYKMTAWDFLSVIPETELTPGQRLIKETLKEKYMNLPEMQRTLDAIKAMRTDKLRYISRFADVDTYRITLKEDGHSTDHNIYFIADGSTCLQQAIIGNNDKLFDYLISYKDKIVNETWENKGNAGADLKESMNIDPVGYTALMIAIVFDRVEMIRKLLEHPNIDIYVKAGPVDAFSLARKLPVEKMAVILPMLKAKAGNVPSTDDCSKYGNLKKVIEEGAPVECLYFYLYKDAMNLDTLKSAVTHVTDVNALNEILSEAENILKTDRTIHRNLWAALKLDTKTKTIEGFRAKISKLVSFGFKLDERAFYVEASGGKTPLEEAYTNQNLSSELSIGLILCTSQVNRIEANSKAPIVLAIENNRAKVVTYLLKKAGDLGLNYEIDCNEAQEKLMHYAITWIKEEDDLIEIVDALLALNPQFLNSQSFYLVKNEVSYDLNGSAVKYNMIKRSKWTPLMYAVMMRKNRVAKHLLKKGADKTIKGLDGVDVDEVIKARCDAYKEATKPPPPPPKVDPVVDERKKRYNNKAMERITKDIMNFLETEYAY